MKLKKLNDGTKIWLEPSKPGISEELWRKGGREYGFNWILKEESCGCDVAYDVGANIGCNTLYLAQRCKKVHSFEPDKRSYRLLKKNSENLTNVELHREAVSDYCGTIKIGLSNMPNMSGVFSKGIKKKVDCTTLDTYAKFADEQVFIKMDLEGGEVAALNGAKKIFESNSKVKLLIELHPKMYNKYNSFEESIKMLNEFGFKMKYVINAKGYKGYVKNRIVKEFPETDRCVATPISEDERYCYMMDGKHKILRSVLWVRE